MKKFLSCDVDGTLIHNHHISTADLDAIKQFRAEGNIFALNTGRTTTWIDPLLEEYPLYCDFLILCTGSMIFHVDPENHRDYFSIHKEIIPFTVAREIIKYFYHKQEHGISFDTGYQTYQFRNRHLKQDIVDNNKAIEISIEEFELFREDIATISPSPIIPDFTKAQETVNYIEKTWHKYVSVFRNQCYVDIASKNSSKATGIRFVENHLSVPVQSFAVGDSFNDLPMFEYLGPNGSFVMDNAEERLKPLGRTVKSVAECIEIILALP